MDKDTIKQIIKDYAKMAQNETTESRLDRIESKIDKLADAMISLARAEEKITKRIKRRRSRNFPSGRGSNDGL